MTRIGVALDIRFGKNTLLGAGSGWVNMHTGHVPGAYHETVIRKAKENRTRSLDEIAVAYEMLDTGLYVENNRIVGTKTPGDILGSGTHD